MGVVVLRFARGRTAATSGIDQEAMRRDLHRALEPLLQDRLGVDTVLRIETGFIGDIRLGGTFAAKPVEVKEIVSAALAEVIQGLETGGYDSR